MEEPELYMPQNDGEDAGACGVWAGASGVCGVWAEAAGSAAYGPKRRGLWRVD